MSRLNTKTSPHLCTWTSEHSGSTWIVFVWYIKSFEASQILEKGHLYLYAWGSTISRHVASAQTELKAHEWISSRWKVIHYTQHLQHLHITYFKPLSWRNRVIVGCLPGIADLSLRHRQFFFRMFLDTNEWIYSGPKVVRYSRHFRHHQMVYWKLRSWWNRVIVWRLPRPSQLSIAQYVIVNRWISSGQKLVMYSHHSRHLQTIYWKLRSWRNRVIWCLPDRADFSLRYITVNARPLEGYEWVDVFTAKSI